MSRFTDKIREVCWEIEEMLSHRPLDVLNESELQAVLQEALLGAFPQTLPLTLASGVANRRNGGTFTCRRVYREARVRSGKMRPDPDIVVLTDTPQTIFPNHNGAPSRFGRPYQAIVATRVDATVHQILAGKEGRAIPNEVLQKNRSKWTSGIDAKEIVNVVYTAHPECYKDDRQVIAIRRQVVGDNADGSLPDQRASQHAAAMFEPVLSQLQSVFQREPYWFLGEKDFETYLFNGMRRALAECSQEVNPVRAHWWTEQSLALQHRRRHDLVVLSDVKGDLRLEAELKTSHSDRQNCFTQKPVDDEFGAMQTRIKHGSLERGIFLLFRLGACMWINDAKRICAKYPDVKLVYQCSEA